MKAFKLGQSVKVNGIGCYPGAEKGDRWQTRVGQIGTVVEVVGLCHATLEFEDGESVTFEPGRDDLRLVT